MGPIESPIQSLTGCFPGVKAVGAWSYHYLHLAPRYSCVELFLHFPCVYMKLNQALCFLVTDVASRLCFWNVFLEGHVCEMLWLLPSENSVGRLTKLAPTPKPSQFLSCNTPHTTLKQGDLKFPEQATLMRDSPYNFASNILYQSRHRPSTPLCLFCPLSSPILACNPPLPHPPTFHWIDVGVQWVG